MNEEFLKSQIEKSLFLTEKMKQQILEYFENLSEKQKQVIEQGIRAEKFLMIQFLKQLKNIPEMKHSQMQEYYKKHHTNIRKSKEHREELEKQEELQNLLLELENI